MPTYSYEAIDATGAIIRDEGTFTSVEGLYEGLRARGLELVSYRRKITLPSLLSSGHIKRMILAEFLRNLSIMIRGGIQIREAMEEMARSPSNKTMKRTLKNLSDRLYTGHLLSDAMEQEKKAFPNIILTLVRIGEETGTLDKTLKNASFHLEKIERIVSATKRAMIYPSIVAATMIGALSFWMIFVLPRLLSLFTEMGLKELPAPTRFLMAAVEVGRTWWFIPPALVFVIFLFFLASRHNEKLRMVWDQAIRGIPLIGRIRIVSGQAFFFEYLSLLTEAGIHIQRSIELMEVSISDRVLKKSIRDIGLQITSGIGISEAFRSVKGFDSFALRMVAVGERTGNLSEQLRILSGHYMELVDKTVEAIVKLIEPALIIISGLIFVVIAAALIGPIYELIGKIS